MRTAEPHPTAGASGGPSVDAKPGASDARATKGGLRTRTVSGSRTTAWLVLALILLVALGLRLWGIAQGLPYVYNIDEAGHFVPKAVAMFSGDLNPHYFVNPPALTYVLHVVFALWLGGAHAVQREYARDPAAVFEVARFTVALFSVASVWLLYAFAARLLGRAVALLACAIEAVAFLPVFYGHFALNDAFTLAPLTLSLLGSAGIVRAGRSRDYALAGIGLGLGCASKYTAGIAIVPLVAAVAIRYLDDPRDGARRALGGIALGGGCALAAFLAANPYALLDFKRFHSDLVHQSSLAEEAQGKLGAPKESGIVYYLWSLTWGLGWVPSLAALAGAIAIWRREARLGWLLVPAPLLFLAFMGLQDRYFGRWLLPIFPIVCVLGAYFAVALISRVAALLARLLPARATAAATLCAAVPIVAATLLQGAIYSVHSDKVVSRADTRNLTRAWLVAHVPAGAKIVLEPVVPNAWVAQRGALAQTGPSSDRWRKYLALRSVIAPDGSLAPAASHAVSLEDYETTLSPALIGWYERLGYCWVITGSTESGRAYANRSVAPLAIAYYSALRRRARLAYHASPYASGARPVAFSFDWSFDYYPLSYQRPGPEMTVYRLTGGSCRAG
jgi:4-amino-4-deoxy-L-arabinose transferase-like glycosyltransferase